MWRCCRCGGGLWNHRTTPSCLDCGYQRNTACCTHYPIDGVGEGPTIPKHFLPREQVNVPKQEVKVLKQEVEVPKQEVPEVSGQTFGVDTDNLDISDQDIDGRLSNVEHLLRKMLRPVELLVPPNSISVVVNMVVYGMRPRIPESHQRITWIYVSFICFKMFTRTCQLTLSLS